MPLIDCWPLVGLRIASPALELRVPEDAGLAVLCELAAAGIHPPDAIAVLGLMDGSHVAGVRTEFSATPLARSGGVPT